MSIGAVCYLGEDILTLKYNLGYTFKYQIVFVVFFFSLYASVDKVALGEELYVENSGTEVFNPLLELGSKK